MLLIQWDNMLKFYIRGTNQFKRVKGKVVLERQILLFFSYFLLFPSPNPYFWSDFKKWKNFGIVSSPTFISCKKRPKNSRSWSKKSKQTPSKQPKCIRHRSTESERHDSHKRQHRALPILHFRRIYRLSHRTNSEMSMWSKPYRMLKFQMVSSTEHHQPIWKVWPNCSWNLWRWMQ